MEMLNGYVPKCFGIKIKSIRKEKSSFICQTERGAKIIRRSLSEIHEIEFQHKVKECLFANDFPNTDRFALSVDSQPFVFFENDIYVMTDYFDNRETVFKEKSELFELTKTVARMHLCLKEQEFPDSPPHPLYSDPARLHSKSESDLRRYKKRLPARLSDLDVIFLKNFAYYTELLENWAKYCASTDCFSRIRTTGICHNAIKEENILLGDGTYYVTNFSDCSKGAPVYDLADIISRYLKSLGKNTPDISAREIAEVYDSVNPLTKDDYSALYAVLKFPSKFMKVAGQYYDKKRSWVPGSLISRMTEVTESKGTYDDYVDELVK